MVVLGVDAFRPSVFEKLSQHPCRSWHVNASNRRHPHSLPVVIEARERSTYEILSEAISEMSSHLRCLSRMWGTYPLRAYTTEPRETCTVSTNHNCRSLSLPKLRTFKISFSPALKYVLVFTPRAQVLCVPGRIFLHISAQVGIRIASPAYITTRNALLLSMSEVQESEG